MINLTAPIVNKLNQMIASGGGGGEGGAVDLTPVLSAVAAVSAKADALQVAVDGIEAPAQSGGGSGGSVIKSIQRINAQQSVPANSYIDLSIAAVLPEKTIINTVWMTSSLPAYLSFDITANSIRLVNSSTQYAVNNVIVKAEVIEYV